MSFHWGIAVYQIVVFGFIILFFVGIYKFTQRILKHFKNTKETLERVEGKIDYLISEKHKN
ncbi:DUF4083 family protein [Paenibacillus gallinarum]|uniref:DUF4083 family protein n=1 Tax=Paenibacillus gallinarum TaxID=2762232 RepID=A0ABR8ST41_9BACL|nr:DUF4083 family protein [Paenibacillus gallinarum]MBD7966662.1 DUF4083 family protein [Paenibacillus gallinarum]